MDLVLDIGYLPHVKRYCHLFPAFSCIFIAPFSRENHSESQLILGPISKTKLQKPMDWMILWVGLGGNY